MNRIDYLLTMMRFAQEQGWGTELERAKREYNRWRKEYEEQQRAQAKAVAAQVRFQQMLLS